MDASTHCGMTVVGPAAQRTAAWIAGCMRSFLPPGHIDALKLADRLEHRQLRQGQIIFTQGTHPDGVWMVRSGELELVAGRGQDRVVVGTLQPCGIAGDVPLLLGKPAVCTVRARTDVQSSFLSAAGFFATLDASPALTRAWLTALAHRHLRAQEAQVRTLQGSAESRAAWLLLREARDSAVTCSQGTLAAMLGMRRQTMNRVIKDFERQGLLRVGYCRLELLAVDRLRQRAQDRA
ncbi:Crp/Fnr family transcriptional regulator [Streptomyces coelicolor]|nr:Crp/Fnr family transcriptional regulator [Streptomyces coelicolor A3(2)]TYP23885.1 Crp/Fnr family transcriptional regulator [Streptomyces coelicolor]TYP43747.1 Crp/Fnr family transcriptional regulator [Streptomyces coelicolor]